MGNKTGRAKQTGNGSYSGYNDTEMPFKDLPELFGPLNGYYYHINDKELAIENAEKNTNHEIPFIFKYNAIDFENIQKDDNKNDNNDDQDDEKKNNNNHDNNNNNMSKEDRFEWVYINVNDKAPYRIITEKPSYSVPEKYAKIRLYLAKHDPIPPYFLRKSRMADKVLQGALKSSICYTEKLKCRIITKNVVGDKRGIRHPALLIWNKNDQFGQYENQSFYIIHLRKLPKKYQSEEEKKQNKDEIEIECRPILMYDLIKYEWEYDKYDEQELNLQHGLVDIAHWCLKYEIKYQYKYHQYSNNCRQFMIALCKEFNIAHDDKDWTDTVCLVVTTSQTIYEWCWRAT